MKTQTLHEFLKANGGVSKVAKSLNLTARGVYKWSNKNALPRTEYTGESNYAEKLSEISGVPTDEIKEMFKPQTQPKTA